MKLVNVNSLKVGDIVYYQNVSDKKYVPSILLTLPYRTASERFKREFDWIVKLYDIERKRFFEVRDADRPSPQIRAYIDDDRKTCKI